MTLPLSYVSGPPAASSGVQVGPVGRGAVRGASKGGDSIAGWTVVRAVAVDRPSRAGAAMSAAPPVAVRPGPLPAGKGSSPRWRPRRSGAGRRYGLRRTLPAGS